MKTIIIILFLCSSLTALAGQIAVVKFAKGVTQVTFAGKTQELKQDDWVNEGSIIKTGKKSIVKLVFIDKSQMIIAPDSTMKFESFSAKDSGIIDLVKGKIRSQVTKDYLQIQNKNKSKLFIKTANAVMGVRGTDFLISSNGKNTSTLLFEGEIAFNRIDGKGRFSTDSLEEMVDRGVRLYPGEFSVMEQGRPLPTVPALLNIQQREKLQDNADLSSDRKPASAEAGKEIVPPGLTGDQVANNSETLKRELVTDTDSGKPERASAQPEAYIEGDKIKPANGSMVDIETGAIIPPGTTAVLDTYSNTFVGGQEAGTVAADGSFLPGETTVIREDGTVSYTVTTPDGQIVEKQITSSTVTSTTTDPVLSTTTTVSGPTTSTGGFTYNDPSRILSGAGGGAGTSGSGNFGSGTTLIIKPQ